MTNLGKTGAGAKPPRRWQTKLSRFFASAWAELSVGALVVVSVALTLMEFTLAESTGSQREKHTLATLVLVNDIITVVFCIELTLRYLAASSKRRFFREYWLDILAAR